MEENIELARRFVEEQLVARGMIADLAIHNPKKAKDKIPNPHMHIMVPIRPLQKASIYKALREYEEIKWRK